MAVIDSGSQISSTNSQATARRNALTKKKEELSWKESTKNTKNIGRAVNKNWDVKAA